jgi:drug/metabolite transporter (DMT)-like permease
MVGPAGALAKIIAEGLMTLYTVIVRTSSFSPLTQSAFRSFIIPIALIPVLIWSGLGNLIVSNLFSLPWILIGIVNLTHIISSFEGFKILPTGPAVTLYFTYPLMAVFLAYFFLNRTITYQSLIGIILAFVGTIVMQYTTNGIDTYSNPSGSGKLTMNWEGIGWILVSAFTEAILYFFVIAGGSIYNNPFFTTFALYAWAGILSLGYLLYIYKDSFLPSPPNTLTSTPSPDRESSGVTKQDALPPLVSYDTLYLLLANIVLGVGGKSLMYASARGLSTGSYAVLSYTGIIFAYIFGLLMGDNTNMNQIIGSILVVIGSLFGGIQ